MSTTTNKTFVPCEDSTIAAAIVEWRELTDWLAEATKKEKDLRATLAKFFFPAPVEGVNRVCTAINGQTLELALDQRVNRKLDAAVLDDVMHQLPEDSPYRIAGTLVAWEPKLVVKGLRTMPDDQRRIFSQALTETPGTPSLEIEGEISAPKVEAVPVVKNPPVKNPVPKQPVKPGRKKK